MQHLLFLLIPYYVISCLLVPPHLVSSLPIATDFNQQRQTRFKTSPARFHLQLSNTASSSHDDVHLLSLKWPSDDLTFSKPVKDAWRWKDSVLGDGRDFFVPKPKTLTALNQYILQQQGEEGASASSSLVQECSVLSNCARFEIIVWTGDNKNTTIADIQEYLSQCLAHQVTSYKQRPFPMLQDQLSRLDSPRLIDTASSFGKDDANSKDFVQELSCHWNCISGVEEVSHHLCLVAAGMALRPNRPDRPVPFQPFSSRDAHILLQLKRTPFEGGNRIKLLLNAALSAGKAARDPQQVPALEQLRRDYGETGNSKYSIAPPAAVTEAAAKAAVDLAVIPAVKDCVERLQAMTRTEPIVQLRRRVDETLAPQNDEEIKWLRKQLHAPTMDLREGRVVDIDALVQDLEEQLGKQRSTSLVK